MKQTDPPRPEAPAGPNGRPVESCECGAVSDIGVLIHASGCPHEPDGEPERPRRRCPHEVGDRVEIRVKRQLARGTVGRIGRVMVGVSLDASVPEEEVDGLVWRHNFEVFTPESTLEREA